MAEHSSRRRELVDEFSTIIEEAGLTDIAKEVGIPCAPVSEHVVWSVSAPGKVFCSRVENGDNGEVVSMPFDHAIVNLATMAGLQCKVGPERWTDTIERRSTSKSLCIDNFTNVDCKPNPFWQEGFTWKTIRLSARPLGPFQVELWKSNDDDRLFALISFAVRFPHCFERICAITLDNAKAVVERELRIIAKEMYNPKLNTHKLKKRKREDTAPSEVA